MVTIIKLSFTNVVFKHNSSSLIQNWLKCKMVITENWLKCKMVITVKSA